jgi:hypothetical protein
MTHAIQHALFPGLMAQSSVWQDVSAFVYLLASIIAVGLAALIWVVFIRKRKKRHSHHHHAWEQESDPRRGRRRQKRSSRDANRTKPPMNPTLSDVGGLPPIREDEYSSSSKPDAPQ